MDRRKNDRKNNSTHDVYIPDIAEIIQVLYKRRLLLLAVILIPMVIGVIYLKTKPKLYQATVSVILESQKVNMADFQDILADIKFDNLTVPTQIEIISSPTLARKTISKLGIEHGKKGNLVVSNNINQEIEYKVLKDFIKNLHVSQRGTSRVVEISFTSKSAKHAAKIVNTHARNYLSSYKEAKHLQVKELNDWVSKQIVELKKDTLAKSHIVQKFKADNGMVQGLHSEDLIYQQISDIAKQLSPIETKELDLQARSEQFKKNRSDSIKEIIESQLIQSLKSRSSIASQELQALKADFGDRHPSVIAAKKEIKQINADIKREIKNIKNSIENELETTIQQKNLLTAKLKNLQEKADTIQEKQISLASLKLEEDASRKLLDNLLARSEEINSQLDFNHIDMRVISFADIPGEPKGSKKIIILIAITMLSTMLALSIVFILEIMNNGIEKKEDIQKFLNLRLLGTLPEETNPMARILNKNRSTYVEEIKRIYIHLNTIENAKTLLFTSAKIGEGKSITAVALAHYLTSIGKRTILIDANTITPQIAKLAKTADGAGLYELLAGTHNIEDVIVTNDEGVAIIPSGEQISFSSDLLVAGRFKEKLAELREEFDYVIIDCASALEVSDAEILSALVDQTIIVAAWSKTPKSYLKKAAEVVFNISKNTPNIILNKVPMKELENK